MLINTTERNSCPALVVGLYDHPLLGTCTKPSKGSVSRHHHTHVKSTFRKTGQNNMGSVSMSEFSLEKMSNSLTSRVFVCVCYYVLFLHLVHEEVRRQPRHVAGYCSRYPRCYARSRALLKGEVEFLHAMKRGAVAVKITTFRGGDRGGGGDRGYSHAFTRRARRTFTTPTAAFDPG